VDQGQTATHELGADASGAAKSAIYFVGWSDGLTVSSSYREIYDMLTEQKAWEKPE
jgi:hypothetical protein